MFCCPFDRNVSEFSILQIILNISAKLPKLCSQFVKRESSSINVSMQSGSKPFDRAMQLGTVTLFATVLKVS